MCDFSVVEVAKTLIFYTHNVIIDEQKKSPVAIRMVSDVIFRHCEGVNPLQSLRDCFVTLFLAMTDKDGRIFLDLSRTKGCF
jgi:hypothetical protein